MNTLNGIKTVLGLALLQFAQMVPAGSMLGLFSIHDLLVAIGTLLTGVGVAHKLMKNAVTNGNGDTTVPPAP